MKHNLNAVIEDFVFADCRLGDHPKVRASLYRFTEKGIELAFSSFPSRESSDFADSPLEFFGYQLGYGNYGFTGIHLNGRIPRSLLSVPLPTDGKPFGALSFDTPFPHVFSQRHRGIAELFAELLVHLGLGSERNLTDRFRFLARALRQAREEAGLTAETTAARVKTSTAAMSRWEAGARMPNNALLLRWCEALGLSAAGSPTIVAAREVTTEFVQLIQSDPRHLQCLSPSQFELFVADRIEKMGFEVRLTGNTTQRDGGIDLIAIPKQPTAASFLLAAQVKHHKGKQKTGRIAVDRLLAWKDSPFRMGLLVTNTFFTKDAMWVAMREHNKAFLRLRDFEDLKRWIVGNFWDEKEWREIPEVIQLAPGLAIRIPKPRLINPTGI